MRQRQPQRSSQAKTRSRLRTLTLSVAVLGLHELGVARPSFWDGVRDPKLDRAEAVLRIAERERHAIEPEYESLGASARLNEKAAIIIELSGGAELSDELSFLLGSCLVNAGLPHDQRGREVLERLLARSHGAPFESSAWTHIAIAAKRAGDTAAEIDALTKALSTEFEYRAELFLRRGQAHMVLQDLQRASDDFLAALELRPNPMIRALGQWALAVALDRSYNSPAALPYAQAAAAVRFGSAGTLSALELPWYPLNPAHDLHYYRALAQLARARQSQDTSDYVGALQASQLLWIAYIKAAPQDDPWLGRAREHLEQLREEVNGLLSDEEYAEP